jgi:phage-related protein
MADRIKLATVEFIAMPQDVKDTFGFAIYAAQAGGKHEDAKPLKGFKGAGVLEVVENHDGDTYRCVYTVKFSGVVYVLDAFQKKSKKGKATPKRMRRCQPKRKSPEARGTFSKTSAFPILHNMS